MESNALVLMDENKKAQIDTSIDTYNPAWAYIWSVMAQKSYIWGRKGN